MNGEDLYNAVWNESPMRGVAYSTLGTEEQGIWERSARNIERSSIPQFDKVSRELATPRQRDYIVALIGEVSDGWNKKKVNHALAEVAEWSLTKGDASRWINKLLHIKSMQDYWAS